jgi:DNA-binding GntR family transcriptional regulator
LETEVAKGKRRNGNVKGGEEVYNFLKDKLIKLEFRPGFLLSENELITRFNLSRTPVRYAISKMESDGLVEIVPRKGALVKYLSMKDMKEIYDIRIALEGAAAGLTISNLDLEKLKEFEGFYLTSLDNSPLNLEKISSVGMEFHDFLVVSAGNERIKKILDDLRVQLSICRIFFLNQDSKSQPSRAIESIREHLSVIEALKRKDVDLARKKMEEHISNSAKYTFSIY